jgi:hypothetical protein
MRGVSRPRRRLSAPIHTRKLTLAPTGDAVRHWPHHIEEHTSGAEPLTLLCVRGHKRGDWHSGRAARALCDGPRPFGSSWARRIMEKRRETCWSVENPETPKRRFLSHARPCRSIRLWNVKRAPGPGPSCAGSGSGVLASRFACPGATDRGNQSWSP